jgi:hypothetical protein
MTKIYILNILMRKHCVDPRDILFPTYFKLLNFFTKKYFNYRNC